MWIGDLRINSRTLCRGLKLCRERAGGHRANTYSPLCVHRPGSSSMTSTGGAHTTSGSTNRHPIGNRAWCRCVLNEMGDSRAAPNCFKAGPARSFRNGVDRWVIGNPVSWRQSPTAINNQIAPSPSFTHRVTAAEITALRVLPYFCLAASRHAPLLAPAAHVTCGGTSKLIKPSRQAIIKIFFMNYPPLSCHTNGCTMPQPAPGTLSVFLLVARKRRLALRLQTAPGKLGHPWGWGHAIANYCFSNSAAGVDIRTNWNWRSRYLANVVFSTAANSQISKGFSVQGRHNEKAPALVGNAGARHNPPPMARARHRRRHPRYWQKRER